MPATHRFHVPPKEKLVLCVCVCVCFVFKVEDNVCCLLEQRRPHTPRLRGLSRCFLQVVRFGLYTGHMRTTRPILARNESRVTK